MPRKRRIDRRPDRLQQRYGQPRVACTDAERTRGEEGEELLLHRERGRIMAGDKSIPTSEDT